MAMKDTDGVTEAITESLSKLRSGVYFISHGLDEKTDLFVQSEQKLEGSTFKKFMEVVAKDLENRRENKRKKGSKKRVKSRTEELMVNWKEWHEFIASQTASHSNTNKKRRRSSTGSTTAKRKKLVKSAVATRDEPPEEHELSRESYEAEKVAILAEIPEKVKKNFGEVGFCDWHKQKLPGLILSPFDVPPGEVRNTWFKMFNKAKAKNRLQHMNYLVFWIGCKDQMSAYSLLAQQRFTPYSKGVAKGLHYPPRRLREKLSGGASLTKGDQEIIGGLADIAELSMKPRDARTHLLTDALEDFEESLDGNGRGNDSFDNDSEGKHDDGAVVEESDTDDDDFILAALKVDNIDAKKKSKKSKGKKMESQIPSGVIDSDVQHEKLPPKKKTKLERGHSKKRKAAQISEGSEDVNKDVNKDVNEEIMEEKIPKFKVKKEGKHKAAKKIVNDDFDGDDEASSDAESEADSDFEEEKEVPTIKQESDENDEDYVDTKPPKNMKQEIATSKSPKAKAPSATKGSTRFKLLKKPTTKKVRTPKQHTFSEEEKLFESCEEKYLPLIKRWKTEIEEQSDAPTVQKTLKEILRVVMDFSAPFIEAYDISPLMKSSKKLIENDNKDLKVYRALWGMLRKHYPEKKKVVPNDFKPTKRVDAVVKVEETNEENNKAEVSQAAGADNVPDNQAGVKIEQDSNNSGGSKKSLIVKHEQDSTNSSISKKMSSVKEEQDSASSSSSKIPIRVKQEQDSTNSGGSKNPSLASPLKSIKSENPTTKRANRNQLKSTRSSL